jgi:hypothetical protein
MIKTKNIIVLILVTLPCLIVVAQTDDSGSTSIFTDKRDNKTYRIVKIGDQTWMAENLNYLTDYSWCYDNANSNCVKYGRLYMWDTAVKVCPAG